ncbi:asparagine synthase (glutamine-hydrolyzing) [uncultured Roseobacter sp.]|uniref:asparagine synthase (glutamine-hydrolyzing) n=1 Tax=uncultured Roseobacter sp. TaxID=114847 RepID=UPI00262ADFDB|nr:asparagine synthase (glutamine-hydrolyzing) [uncultured Roseobacter sp.]
MCGLLAVLGLPKGSKISRNHIEVARDIMAKRGPDAASLIEIDAPNDKTHFLAHRRLSIQDLSAQAQQPMTSASGLCSIVYNGEVYNTKALRDALEGHGIKCRTTSDTELILEGYELWGSSVVEKLNGMFAFLIWDKRSNTAFLARDRVGIKPLYVARTPGGLACASDLRALRALGFGTEINKEAQAQYLMLGYVPAPNSIWEGIEKVDAGTTLTWSQDGTVAEHTYWSAPEDTDYESSKPPLSDLIDTVVEEHLLSDVPVGLFLSGGMDSSIVAASVANLGSEQAKNMTALTIAYPGNAASDEAPVAQRTADMLNLDFKVLSLNSASDHSYEKSVAALDEPLAYNAVVSQSAISELAAQSGLKVVLSGDGGDEVFGGYRWHEFARASDFTLTPQRGFKNWLKRLKGKNRIALHEAALGDATRKLSDMSLHAFRVFPALRPDHVAQLMNGMSKSLCEDLLTSTLGRYDAPGLPWKRRMQRVDLYTFCQDVVLPKVDRAGMAYSVEARPPMLDHRIIEWGLSHPETDDFDAHPKNVLRKIVRDRGLGFLLDEPKRGFSLKLGTGPDPDSVVESIDRSREALGISSNWRNTLHDKTELLSIKMDTMYFLSLWEQSLNHDPLVVT